ncbi:hypothetical protein [Tardiphaga sp. 768_D3_N2_1]|uniref:hypothetical protein n=1 Tax=Tardiphaga sp. 768_D3_N2_1 TaxID=3240783 RepID=UPI003F8BD81D
MATNKPSELALRGGGASAIRFLVFVRFAERACAGLVEVVAHGGFRMFAVSGSKPIA